MVRILIIEDDFAMAEAMKKQILSWGHEALCVQDFQRVTETFVQYDPHMVLVDIMLPFYNGYYWCSAIRKILLSTGNIRRPSYLESGNSCPSLKQRFWSTI